MKPRSMVASLAAALLTMGTLVPIAFAAPDSGAQQATESAAQESETVTTERLVKTVLSGASAPDQPESGGEDSTFPLTPDLVTQEPESGSLGPVDSGDSNPSPSGQVGEQQSGSETLGDPAEEDSQLVAQFFTDKVENECPDTTVASTLAGAVKDYVPGSQTVDVDLYLDDEVVASGSPDVDDDGHFVFPVESLETEGEYRAEVRLLVDGEPSEEAEAFLTVWIDDCLPPSDASKVKISKDIKISIDTSCRNPNSNVSISGRVDDLDVSIVLYEPDVLVTVAGQGQRLPVRTNETFSAALGFFAPGPYKATLQYRRLLHPERIVPVGMGDPVTVTFTVPDDGCSTPFSGDFTLIKDPGCVPAGQTAMVTLEGAFTAPGEHKNHRLVATIAGTKEKAVEVWRGSHPGLKRFMYTFKNRLSAGTYVVQLRMEYDSGPFFFYSWVFMDPYMYTEMTIPTCASGVGDAETPPSSQDQTAGTTTRADAAPTTSATGLAKTGVSVLPVFLVGAIALASGLALKMRRTREG